MKILKYILCLAILSTCLTSCGVVNEFFAKLGFDTHDYEGEAVIATYESDSDKAKELAETVRILSVNSSELPTFNGTKEGIEACRDSLLNYMLVNNYSKYTGNLTLLDSASAAYPYLKISTVIPADDFENEAYRYFGGKQKVENQSGKLFTYLDKIDSYTTVAEPTASELEIKVSDLVETENTFRFKFRCSLDGEDGEEYFALIIKRSDESYYFKYVERADA